jgi:hypothetical protein
MDEHTEATRLHEVRIAAKKLRYLVDVTPAFHAADDLERILGALKRLLRVLGDFNDAHLQEERLLECGRALTAAGAPAGAALALKLRLGRPFPGLVDSLCTLVGDRTLRRIESRSVLADTVSAEGPRAS